jgi:hypothetical protein
MNLADERIASSRPWPHSQWHILDCGKMTAARESPSGKASAFQADMRGFESHLPL